MALSKATAIRSTASISAIASATTATAAATGGATAGVTGLASALTVLSGPIGWAIAGIAALGVGAYTLDKHMSKDSIGSITRFGDEISESTQKAVGAFMDLEEQTTITLNQMVWSGSEVTKEMKDTLVSNFDDMHTQISIDTLPIAKARGFLVANTLIYT